MIPRRYVQKHIRDRRSGAALSAIDKLKAEYERLGSAVSDLEFSITLMPDGLEKIKAMLIACDLYLRREDVALKVDYHLAKSAK